MNFIRSSRFFFFLFMLILCTGGGALAQQFPGRITGTVRDTQGSPVAGAAVKLTNPSTGLARSITTDETGDFNFPELALGTYQLSVSKDGFKTAVITEITTSQDKVNTVSPVLAVGSVSSQVEVTADTLLLQTETNSAGGELTEKQITSLPIGNSDFTRLALVLPGAVQNSNFAFAQYSINGSRARSNGFNVDGASNTDPSTYLPSINEGGNSATAATRLPLDAIEEVSVVSAGSGADLGQNSGSVMNAVVKSGTNQFHGSGYEVHRDAALDAANFFENLRGVSKAPFVWNEFGGSIGGPVVLPGLYDGHDRTFFFGAYDGSRLRLGTTLSGAAPTSDQIENATSLLAAQGMAPNPLGQNILGLYTSLGLTGPFVIDNRGQQSPNSFVLKVDHRFSTADSISTRFLYGEGEDEFPGGGPGPGGGSQLSPWFGVTPTHVANYAISEVHVFSPSLINTFRLGYNRFSQFQKGRDANVDPMSIGLNTGVGPESFGIPEIDIGSNIGRFANLGLQNGAGGRVATSYQVADEFNWTRGRHSMQFGFNYLHNYSDYTLVGTRGILTFDGSVLGQSLVEAETGRSPLVASGPGAFTANDFEVAGLVDLLGGLPTPGNNLTDISRVLTGRTNIAQNIVSEYFTDNFKATSKLTLIAGLRYDFLGTVNETRGRFSSFDPTLGLVPVSQLPGGQLYNAPKGNLGPRVGLAWVAPVSLVPGRQMVVRAGYGIYYDTAPLNNFQGQSANPIGNGGGFTVVPTAPIPFGVGVPIFGSGGAGGAPGISNINSVDHNLKTPNTQAWNLNIQQELNSKVVFQIGYVGNKSTHQLQQIDINQPTPNDGTDEQSHRPFNTLFPNFAQINTLESNGWANYHSLQATLKASNWHNLTTQVSFTWSHNLDTASEVSDFFGTSGFVPQDATNLRGSYGNSEFDQRRSLVFTYIYAIPTPKVDNKVALFIKDWQVSGTTTYRDGLATPVLTFGDEAGVGNSSERPDCVGPFHYNRKNFVDAMGNPLPYVDPSAFATPAPGTFGNCPRNPIVAPGLISWDISIQRTFRFTERFAFEFRTSFFNAFNHPNFAEPSPNVGGNITATADDGSFDSHFGVGGPRNIQFMGKLRF